MENYKEIIDRNINYFNEHFSTEFNEEVIDWHNQSLISFLEEENRRLKGEYVEGTDDRPTTYNKAIREQIKHNLQVITYLKGL